MQIQAREKMKKVETKMLAKDKSIKKIYTIDAKLKEKKQKLGEQLKEHLSASFLKSDP